ncbi:patatin-like phospholipase family protein [uncultured Thiodictyon sp.]|uniref:patatin-like phospholipase family protein n=1 Tax=uncultured Thiodictyon sp. TaxID=1846217 RepID=UPI0026003414|nr:patatin-like phospholipase family protein [uncultured Thiodictyon sp.]
MSANTKPDDQKPTTFETQLEHELRAVAWTRQDITNARNPQRPPPEQDDSEPPSKGPPPSPASPQGTRPEPGRCVYDRAFDSNLLGLAFSGGGIRSATFHLGVIQGLAKLRLLHRVDYLSTVSGGGYIGGWLTSWVHRRAGDIRPGILAVEDALCGPRPSTDSAASPPEPRQVRWLREFSNYLTPRVGALSTDTLTAVATYIRNLILNQTILVAFGAALLVLPWFLCALLPLLSDGWLEFWFLSAALLLFIGSFLAGHETLHAQRGRCAAGTCPDTDQKTPRVYWVLFSCFAAAAALGGIAITYRPELAGGGGAILYGCAYGLGTSAGWWLGMHRCKDEAPDPDDPERDKRWRWLPVWTMVAAAGLGFMVYLWADFLWGDFVAVTPHRLEDPSHHVFFAVTLGPLALLGAILLTTTLHLGLSGRRLREAAREVWNCHGAHQLRFGIIWLALTGSALFGPLALMLTNTWVAAAGGLTWVVTTIAGVLAGASEATGVKTTSRTAELAARIAPFVFVLGVLLALSYAVYQTMWWTWDKDLPQPWQTSPATRKSVCESAAGGAVYQVAIKLGSDVASGTVSDAPAATYNCLRGYVEQSVRLLKAPANNNQESAARPYPKALSLFLAIGALLLVATIMSWRVDINVFSLHMFYRNRLERCFMGASNLATGRRHPLTGLDPTDAPKLKDLVAAWPPHDGNVNAWLAQRPFPIVNTALNITSAQNLAWQERKAASFTFTPMFCGYELEEPDGRLQSCYQRTRDYLGGYLGWISFGLPITVSGAAASPNGGYHTNPATAFLMTVFNVRLGWWMPNPRYLSQWHKTGPRLSLLLLLEELSGMSSDRCKYVYLSDGGHFENLGIYELVRRRCRYIIAGDAGCDPTFGFEDLGNAVRKCKIDLGIDIDIDPRAIRPDATTGYSAFHCVVGRIHYEQADQAARPGFLVYLKSSLTGEEPADVLQYAAAQRHFPHESTADQSYTESQFESYRKLGLHVAWSVLADAVAEHRSRNADGALDMEELFTTLTEIWYPPSAQVQTSFAKYGEAIEAIFATLRKDLDLAFLDEQFYPEWRHLMNAGPGQEAAPTTRLLPDQPAQVRAGFYFCSQLLQLMENVYVDLNLETQYDHPDNRGWMNLFRHWSWAQMFQVTWAISASTYGIRFQRFCRRRLSLSLGTVASRAPVPFHDLEQHAELNFVELDLVRRIVAGCFPDCPNTPRVVQLVLQVFGPLAEKDKPAFSYPFAFALIDGSEDEPLLVYYRVQDHLRATGLGRMGLSVLLEEGTVKGVVGLDDKSAKDRPVDGVVQAKGHVLQEVSGLGADRGGSNDQGRSAREADCKAQLMKAIPDTDYPALYRLWNSVVTAAQERGGTREIDRRV